MKVHTLGLSKEDYNAHSDHFTVRDCPQHTYSGLAPENVHRFRVLSCRAIKIGQLQGHTIGHCNCTGQSPGRAYAPLCGRQHLDLHVCCLLLDPILGITQMKTNTCRQTHSCKHFRDTLLYYWDFCIPTLSAPGFPQSNYSGEWINTRTHYVLYGSN